MSKRGILLNDDNQYNEYGTNPLHDDKSSSIMSQRKTIKSWLYYLLLFLVTGLTISSIICAAGWATAEHHAASESEIPPNPITAPGDLPNVLLPIVPQYPENTLMGQIKTFKLIDLLSSIYRIAMENGGNRAINNPGFNATVEFLLKNIERSTNLVNIERTYFLRKESSKLSEESLAISIDGTSTSYETTDWRAFGYSMSMTDGTSYPVINVPNACDSTGWPSKPAGNFWVIAPLTSNCSAGAKATLAETYGASGFIVPTSASSTMNGVLPPHMTYRGISLTAPVATTVITAINNGSIVTIQPNFKETHVEITVSNICADTPQGDPTSVVLVGGHSDGVPRGPGVNDDGSGSVATLVMAMGVTKLINNGTYNLPNMIKFCWFGGEELGLLGSKEIVRQGLLANADPKARVGSRAKDWAMMIDLDMLGSMNFMNYIYDANNHIPENTPISAFNGSRTQTNLFFEFFRQNGLPADSDKFDGRSDYGPFLEVGIPAGGVDAGADKTKNESTRIRYQEITGWGGIAGVQLDQCYHQACDTIENIHWGVYTNMTMSAAYVLEKCATRENLREWIDYPLNQQMPNPKGKLAFEFRSRSSHETETDEMY